MRFESTTRKIFLEQLRNDLKDKTTPILSKYADI